LILLLAFALSLLAVALTSGPVRRTPLSTAVLFLGAGFVVGRGALGLVVLPPDNALLVRFAELALISVLFVDGTHVDLHDLIEARRLPERALPRSHSRPTAVGEGAGRRLRPRAEHDGEDG
jgi:sodium/hydrogen antiporter